MQRVLTFGLTVAMEHSGGVEFDHNTGLFFCAAGSDPTAAQAAIPQESDSNSGDEEEDDEDDDLEEDEVIIFAPKAKRDQEPQLENDGTTGQAAQTTTFSPAGSRPEAADPDQKFEHMLGFLEED